MNIPSGTSGRRAPTLATRYSLLTSLLGTAVLHCSAPQTGSGTTVTAVQPAQEAGTPTIATVDAGPPVDPSEVALRSGFLRGDSPREVSFAAPPVALAVPGGASWTTAVMRDTLPTTFLVASSIPPTETTWESEILANDATEVRSLLVRDVTGDNNPEVVIYRTTADEDGNFLYMYAPTATEDGIRLRRLIYLPVALIGESDPANLDTALAHAKEFEAPRDGHSLPRFLIRLSHATLEQFKTIVPPTGIKVCTDLPDRTERRRKHCKPALRAAQITQQIFTHDIMPRLSGYGDVETLNSDVLQAPACSKEGADTHCSANVGGPSGNAWIFTGEGASLRLKEVSVWGESS